MKTLCNKKVLISGASIAGPAIGLWLARYGFEVTLVEKAKQIRPGGQDVDFKGATHRRVLQQMGIYEDLQRARSIHQGDGAIVNAAGRQIATVPAAFSAGELEISRGTLARILFEHTRQQCHYIFDDSITSLHETAQGVEVTFQQGQPQRFDLVIGADGIHSNVRKLAFGPESDYVHHLGYYYALAKIDGELTSQDLMYNEPGRMASTGGAKAPAFFVFASKPLPIERDNLDQQKALLTAAYQDGGWKIPALLAALPDAEEFYLDAISRATVDHYAQGRVVLLGDSAYGNTLGGFGTGLAIVGAYVLAGELARAQGDYQTAYRQYEIKFRAYAKVSEQVNAGKLLAPTTRLGLWTRNRLFSLASMGTGLIKLMDYFASDIKLEDYMPSPTLAI